MAHRRLSRGEKIVIASHNAGKLREVAALLALAAKVRQGGDLNQLLEK